MRVYLFLILLLILSSCATENRINISKTVFHCHKNSINLVTDTEINSSDARKYHYCRKKLSIFNKLKLDITNDTLYILETHGNILYNSLESTLFTRDTILSYRFENKKKISFKKKKNAHFKGFSNKPLYPRYMLKLATWWDMDKIKKECSKGDMMPQDFYFLTRIIFKDKKYKIDCVHFKYVYDLERDLYDSHFATDYQYIDMKTLLSEIFNLSY